MEKEEQLNQEITLRCDGRDCKKQKTDKRKNLVEDDWAWKEGSVHGLFRITGVQCPECDIDIQKVYKQEKEEAINYYEDQNKGEDKDLKMSSKHKNQKTLGELS